MDVSHAPILLVEDMPQILKFLEVTLTFKGYTVATANNGQEALAFITKQYPALVITDILMPKLDGYALAQRIRTDPKTRNIPIIFLSATYVTPEDKAFALSLGAVHFLEKPVDTEEFLLTVAEVLTQKTIDLPAPMDERKFYTGYQERLGNKLRHKTTQIARTERLLETLAEEQKEPFKALLANARLQRNEILQELNIINRLLESLDTSKDMDVSENPTER